MTRDAHRRDDDAALCLALLRYQVVAGVLEHPDGRGTGELVREAAEREYHLPGRGALRVCERTVYAWMAAYRRGGVEALRPRARGDRGALRALSEDVLARAARLREEQPRRSTTTILDILVREGTVPDPPPFHRATLDRHLRRIGKSRRRMAVLATTTKVKMRFETFGELWVGDYHHGPLVRTPTGGVTTAKLGAFLDHTTRYPVADRYYLSEDLPTLRDTLLRALLRFGAPRVAYVDRGSVYRSDQLAYSLARVGCRLVHSKPYYSEGRGVVERWWQVAGAFEDEVRAREELLTIHELCTLWEAYREERYGRAVHGALGTTPEDALAAALAAAPRRPLEPALVRELFLVGERRTVHKKDGCVSVAGRRFLCDGALRGERVEVRFDPHDLSSVLILVDGKKVQTAFPQVAGAAPEKPPEVTPAPPGSVDYLSLVRRDYDRHLLAHARPLAYADLRVEEGFDEERFVAVLSELAGLCVRESEREALAAFWKGFGPLPEDLVRIGVEHAARLHGRARHVETYLAAVRTLVLAHWRGGKE